jgi:catechol 2,3-dioxygenase-like lactoylglutathione lyase family enzyme
MTLRWDTVVIDTRNAAVLGRWWAEALGWEIVDESDDEIEVANPAGTGPNLLFGNGPDEKAVKNRLHLDFVPGNQSVEVERLAGLGASRIDIGQGDATWVVMADPEGNEFCVLSARAPGTGLSWEQVVIDSADPQTLGRWWAEALGWKVIDQDDESVELAGEGDGPHLFFLKVPDTKTVKNRLHLDLVPDDQQAEVSRLLGLGARHADIGQGEPTWVVMADPEGNEFCVLSARSTTD